MLTQTTNNLNTLSSAFTQRCIDRFGDKLLGLYFYGSSTTDDFTVTSDYDFVAIVKSIDYNTMDTVNEILKDVKPLPGSDKLEGGFHVILPDHPWKDTVGIWVDKGMRFCKCLMHVEPDSIFSITRSGKHCYGAAPAVLLPAVTECELMQFERNYILEFIDNIPRRSDSAQRLYGAFLNACRSACYITDKEYTTKSQAAKRICDLIPELSDPVKKALQLREEEQKVSITENDLESCQRAVNLLISLIGGL